MKQLLFAAAVALSLAACSDTSCKNMCTQLDACGLSKSNVSCDEDCKDQDAECAACINDNECADVKTECASVCPASIFEAKK